MVNTPHNHEELKSIFESLPLVDDSRSDLRIINLDLLQSIVSDAERRASLLGSIKALKDADSIVSDVFSKSFPSL